MNTNTVLHKSKKNANDEFYTKMIDVENEMQYYVKHFIGKVLYFNCDNPDESAFWRYFHINFAKLGLKKIISTHYNENGGAYKKEYKGGNDSDVSIGTIKVLQGDGDFRSEECIEILNESDIVVTNPPFSFFREYVTQLIQYKKKFLIIGNMNAITYKEIFPLIKSNEIWLGVSLKGTKCSFIVPNSYEGKNTFFENGQKMARINNAIWFTNLDHQKRHEILPLTEHYNPTKYIKYDNYNAINIDRLNKIPMDYHGTMGVPITYLYKHNPEQFDIIAFRKGNDGKDLVYTENNKQIQPYFRILIQPK